MLKDLNKKIDVVIDIYVGEEILVECLVGWFICSNCGVIYYKIFNFIKVEDICDCCGGYEFY